MKGYDVGELMSGMAVVVMMMMMMTTMMMTATITATIPLQLLHFFKRVSGSVASFPAPCSRIDSTGSQRLTTRHLYLRCFVFNYTHVFPYQNTLYCHNCTLIFLASTLPFLQGAERQVIH